MKIHRYWEGEPRPEHNWSATVVQSVHPRASLRDWTPESLPPEVQTLVQSSDVRHNSNVARYALLHQMGGLWLDHDVIPLQDLISRLDGPWVAGLGHTYEGCVMYFPRAGHPALGELIERATSEASQFQQSPRRSGSVLLTEVLPKYPDVRREPRVLPFDSQGKPTAGRHQPLAVHMWVTSNAALYPANR